MIEQNVLINVNENIDVIMNFIINHMDQYINSGKIKSIRKVVTYTEEIIFDFEDNTSKTMISQVNNFYNGKYDVKYTKIDEENTTIDITFNFELLLHSYSLFTFSTIMETIISQIFCSEMKNFYKNFSNDIKEFFKNNNINSNDKKNDNSIQNDILNIKKHKKNKTQKIST